MSCADPSSLAYLVCWKHVRQLRFTSPRPKAAISRIEGSEKYPGYAGGKYHATPTCQFSLPSYTGAFFLWEGIYVWNARRGRPSLGRGKHRVTQNEGFRKGSKFVVAVKSMVCGTFPASFPTPVRLTRIRRFR